LVKDFMETLLIVFGPSVFTDCPETPAEPTAFPAPEASDAGLLFSLSAASAASFSTFFFR
jgi:hypothetical protein